MYFSFLFLIEFSGFFQLIECLLKKEDLTEEEAEGSLNFLLSDGNEALISAFLVLLRAKGETYEEVMHLSVFFFFYFLFHSLPSQLMYV